MTDIPLNLRTLLFVVLVSLPGAVLSAFLYFRAGLDIGYVLLLILGPVPIFLLIYGRLCQEIDAAAKRIGQETDAEGALTDSGRGGLLAMNSLLLNLQQYRRHARSVDRKAKSERRQAALLFDMLPDAVLVLDRQRRPIRTNRAAAMMLGEANLKGALAASLWHPNLLKAVEDVLVGGKSRQIPPFRLPGAVARYVSAYVAPLPLDEEQNDALVIALHDVTRSEKLEQMRVDFVANASHELRTPLAVLIATLETLLGPAKGDQKALARFLPMMDEQAKRMSQLIDDLLLLSRIEANEHSRPHEPVNLVSILHSVRSLMETRAGEMEKQIHLKAAEMPLYAAGNGDQLTQVFANLVDNGLKYGASATAVMIELSASDGNIIIRVIDEGDGIPAEHIPRLTERFYRVDSDRSRKLGGTGLGLAIVKHIVNRHRGELTIASSPGKGSVFTVNLPRLGAPSDED